MLTGKEEVVFEKLKDQGIRAIEEDGADVIILGSTTMHQSHRFLRDNLPAPVINPGVVDCKLCEALLEMGLTHSKRAFPSPETIQDELLFPGR